MLKRPAAGKGEESVSFTVNPKGMEKWRYEGKIAPRIYSAKELDELMNEAKNYIDENIFYEGESADSVITGIKLINKAPSGPVKISWEGEGLKLFDNDGLIKEEQNKNFSEIYVITAKLSCQDYICYYDIPFKIGSINENDKEEKKRRINEVIEEKLMQKEESEESRLPGRIEGLELKYTSQKRNTLLSVGLLLLMLPAIYVAKQKEDDKKKTKDRENELLNGYSDLVGKFVILLGAGMNVHNIFGRLASEYEQRLSKTGKTECLYEEVAITYGEIRSGVYEKDAFESFGRRIGLLPYIRFASILTQNLREGTAGIVKRLEEEQINALKDRKALATQMGERLETKILFPMLLELMIVLLIIMVPAFMSM